MKDKPVESTPGIVYVIWITFIVLAAWSVNGYSTSFIETSAPRNNSAEIKNLQNSIGIKESVRQQEIHLGEPDVASAFSGMTFSFVPWKWIAIFLLALGIGTMLHLNMSRAEK